MHSTFDKSFSAFLFDMDGTLLNSIAAAERVWGVWAARQGLDVEAFLPTMHGKRGIDTITALNLPGIDVQAEAAYIEQAEIDDVEGIVPIPGVHDFLESLPSDRWAIVTSAPRALAVRRLEAAGIVPPDVFVAAEDVTQGKPNPAPFLLAAERLGVDPQQCLVFEDAPAGIKAGETAAGTVVIITATHHEVIETRHLTVENYSGLRPLVHDGGRIQLAKRV